MSRTPNRRRCSAGFTLLEMIVVIGIFALMAAMAYGGLATVLKTRAQLDTSLNRIGMLQKVYWIMRDDFQNGLNRSILDDNGQVEFALQYVGIDHRVAFTRAGWPNPLNLPRSTLRRLGYFYDDDKKQLMRRTWPVLDRAPRTQPDDTLLLKNVDAVQWRFLDASGQWQDSWPTPSALQSAGTSGAAAGAGPGRTPPPPHAVELTMQTSDWGKLRWLFSYGLPRLSGNLQDVNGLSGGVPGSLSQTPSLPNSPAVTPIQPTNPLR